MNAVITVPVCPLMTLPDCRSERADETLFGWTVELTPPPESSPDCPDWFRVTTHYRYGGYAPSDALLSGDAAQRWALLPKQVVLGHHCDVLAAPGIRAPLLFTLTRGALLAPAEAPDDRGWQRVLLPDGQSGYVRASWLGDYCTQRVFANEDRFRAAVVATACGYLGTQYRWGGRTTLGIDCSGLCSMAYLLHGVVIFRDARIEEGFPVHPIPRSALRPADLLYFPGHIALWLGNGQYLHATARTGSDGVVVNSLRPSDWNYREDLDRSMLTGGSIF